MIVWELPPPPPPLPGISYIILFIPTVLSVLVGSPTGLGTTELPPPPPAGISQVPSDLRYLAVLPFNAGIKPIDDVVAKS